MTDVLILATVTLAAALLVLFGWAMVRRSRARVAHRRVFAVAIRAGMLRRLGARPAPVDPARYPAPDWPEELEPAPFDVLRRPGDVVKGSGTVWYPVCRNCRGTLVWCDENGCGSRREAGWRSKGVPE